jgi:hypothetical protein
VTGLLNDVGELVREQAAARGRSVIEPGRLEEDIRADGEG